MRQLLSMRHFRIGPSSRGKMTLGWERCMKYILCCLNIFIMIGGLTVIAAGIWTVIDKLSLESLLGTNLYMSAAWILIGTGCGVIVVAFFGCLGAIRGVRCMLMTVEESMRQQMHDSMIRDYGYVKVIDDAWNTMQQTLECCAVDAEYNLTNWIHSRWYEKQPTPRPLVPETCCRLTNDSFVKGSAVYVNLTECQSRSYRRKDWPNPAFVNVQPCLQEAKHGVQEHAVILGGIGIAIACSLIFGMIFSLCLFREII
ncbi:CD151 antigen-like isoform X2 [Paramacrobiotus metropolitanus]|uniref:CD151 antigen-like isoform X2 n=1 Tax=Paramacrobiotus metropolitanus TaxID=2943436 RepID=UPI00244618B3|nr:CD151 antigen-like isoform X2 [Paramacrobiotus metropolitanus]